MKKILFIGLTLLLTSCSKPISSSEEMLFDYIDVQDRFIKWKDVLSQSDTFYYAYIFSYSCGHCKDIKQDILNKTIKEGWNVYYVEFTSEIPVVDSNVLCDGITNYEELGIIGTPTLFKIMDHAVSHRFTGSKEIIETLYNN